MKKFVIAMLMVAGSSATQADYVVKNADGSELSQLCVAAVKSDTALLATAESIGLDKADLATVRCNGLTLDRFAARYGKTSSTPASIGYVLKGSDSSETTALCIAAASSEQEYRRVKAAYFAEESKIETEVLCNGLSLKSFARKYGKPAMAISQR